MSSYFTCMAYSDVESTIRLADDVVYISFKDSKDNVHVTLNPAQALCLTKELQFALSNFSISDITTDDSYGDISVEISVEDYEEEKLAEAVPF